MSTWSYRSWRFSLSRRLQSKSWWLRGQIETKPLQVPNKLTAVTQTLVGCSPFVPLHENWGSFLKIWCNRSTMLQACCRSYCMVSDLFDVHEQVVKSSIKSLLRPEGSMSCLYAVSLLSCATRAISFVVCEIWGLGYFIDLNQICLPVSSHSNSSNKPPVLIPELHDAPGVNPAFSIFGPMYTESIINVFHPPPKSKMLLCWTTTAAALHRAALVSMGAGKTQREVLCLDFNTDSLTAHVFIVPRQIRVASGGLEPRYQSWSISLFFIRVFHVTFLPNHEVFVWNRTLSFPESRAALCHKNKQAAQLRAFCCWTIMRFLQELWNPIHGF